MCVCVLLCVVCVFVCMDVCVLERAYMCLCEYTFVLEACASV